SLSPCRVVFFFFFQAEDGIRDRNVTGVQTCALPIFAITNGRSPEAVVFTANWPIPGSPKIGSIMKLPPWRCIHCTDSTVRPSGRSEERRVGKEWRAWG